MTLGSKTLALTAANNTFNGTINGTGGGFTVSAGTETLNGPITNGYTGLTSISGTLVLTGYDDISASSGVLDSGTFDISGNGATSIKTLYGSGAVVLGGNTLTLTNAGPAGTGSFSGIIGSGGDSGGLTISGGAETLSGINGYTGTTTINAPATLKISGSTILSSAKVDDEGTLTLTSAASIKSLTGTTTGVVNLDGNILTLTAAAGDTFGGVIGDSLLPTPPGQDNGGLAITSGTETLTGVNIYHGDTTIGGTATLVLGSGGSIANSRVVDNGTLDVSAGSTSVKSLSGGGGVTLGSAATFTLSAANDTFDGIISGGTSTFEIASGVETLTNVNTYSGTTLIDSGGQLSLTGTGSIADSAGLDDNGTFNISGTSSGATITELYGSGSVTLGSQTLTIDNAESEIVAHDTFDGTINGTTGGLTIATGWEELTGSQHYGGATTIANGATLVLGATGDISTATGVADNGSFVINANTSIKSLSGALSGVVTLNGNTLTITTATSAIPADYFSGNITDGTPTGGSLTIAGGTQTLSGTNEYTGATTIGSSATLAITGLPPSPRRAAWTWAARSIFPAPAAHPSSRCRAAAMCILAANC